MTTYRHRLNALPKIPNIWRRSRSAASDPILLTRPRLMKGRSVMSLETVKAFLAVHAPDIDILEAQTSTATVAEAAATHGVEPAQIAKTRSEEHTSELQSLMRISYAVFCLKKKKRDT